MNPHSHVLEVRAGKEKGNKKETKKDQPEKEKVQQESLGAWKLREKDTSMRRSVSCAIKFRHKLTPVL